MHFGQKGQADLYGWRQGGLGIEVELKAAGGRLTPEQERWRSFCKWWGIEHHVLVARKDETAEETVERWIGELK